MHIGFLTPEYVTPRRPEGGLANYLRKTGLALAARGHSVSMLVLSDQAARWDDGKIEVHEIPRVKPPAWLARRLYPLFPMVEQIRSSRRLAAQLWHVHAAKPFDVLQASSYLAPGYALRRNGRVPMVCRISSYAPMLRAADGRQRHQAEYLSDWLEVRQIADADAAFAPSRFVADVLERVEGISSRVIRTSIDLAAVEPDQAHYQKHLAGKRYLLYFGALSRLKGVDLLAEALQPLLEKYDWLNVAFIGRDDGLAGAPKAFDCVRARCQNAADRLHYSPSLSKAQLLPVIAGARAVLMPSRVDNYPNACLEAQAQGVPVIACDRSSLEEMMVDGQTGFLAANGDAVSLRSAIERCLQQSSPEQQAMRERILEQVRKINAEDRVGQLLDFYQSVIGGFKRVA